MKKVVFSVFAVFAALIISACSGGDSTAKQEANASSEQTTQSLPQEDSNATSSALDKIKENGVIRIGVFSDKPPFGFVDTNGVNQGYDVYFAKRLAQELLGDENKIQFVLVEAANRVEFLKSDKVDVILANFTQTPERAEQVDFTLPYMKVALGVAVKSDLEVNGVDDLKDKTLILNKGTTADAYFTANYPEIKTLKFDQNTEAFAALLDGRGEALAHDNTLLFAWTKENPNFKVAIKELGNQDVIAAAVAKGNDELKNFINDLITKLGDEQFFHKAYDETLKTYFTEDINADDVVIEGGKL
ncbi:ABC transporter substrate-binding protein [Campylobacter sp. MIT 99-7217]|uniref:cysteine ABC transporter substrate-binding protein n=1 Tax=Campylobacter sp. MIT 99-7217 TaxID=535091 RepID=UPI001156D124|nr:cysteine ABC transporter substrate-binding protein [Campylobacter sp. MIT 99-7217]TQR32997.1 ABC transporter substrate-binding protein [Campylobacter sp. MIT 99-7217]